MKKKLIALILAALMVVFCISLAACKKGGDDKDTTAASQDGSTEAPADATASDLEYVKGKGKLVVGITDFAPMDYQEEGSDEWIGFDADLARKFAASLGVKAEFVPIEWSQKIMELDGKTIDCVWNGMTITDEVKAAMSVSNAYCLNAQVVVVREDVADKYQTAEDCMELNFAVEDGSAGQEVAEENGFTCTEVLDQATALLEVSSGTADAAIIDLLMADAMIGEGTSYANLTYTVKLNSEEYGVGFRAGSDLTAAFNEFYAAAIADGTVDEIANTYGISAESLIK